MPTTPKTGIAPQRLTNLEAYIASGKEREARAFHMVAKEQDMKVWELERLLKRRDVDPETQERLKKAIERQERILWDDGD